VVRQAHLIAVVGVLLIGCAALFVGCAGGRSQAPEEQGHTEATKEQARSPEATASEEARCEGTRTFQMKGGGGLFTTNDVPGCPTGGLLSGTDERDKLDGKKGEDEIHGLGGVDVIFGKGGNDVIYGGPGDDTDLFGGPGDDVLYGGMATISWSGTGSGTSSIAVKVGTNTMLMRMTTWTAAARRSLGWDQVFPRRSIARSSALLAPRTSENSVQAKFAGHLGWEQTTFLPG
jgi:RTX calcium-binding nonapeptide repeat (4 copies)